MRKLWHRQARSFAHSGTAMMRWHWPPGGSPLVLPPPPPPDTHPHQPVSERKALGGRRLHFLPCPEMSVRHHHTKSWLFVPKVPGVLLTSVPSRRLRGRGRNGKQVQSTQLKFLKNYVESFSSSPKNTQNILGLYIRLGAGL